MQVQIRYFAAAREATGLEREALELGADETVAGVFRALVVRHPALAGLERTLRFALDAEFADPADAVPAGATLALIPPVGGG